MVGDGKENTNAWGNSKKAKKTAMETMERESKKTEKLEEAAKKKEAKEQAALQKKAAVQKKKQKAAVIISQHVQKTEAALQKKAALQKEGEDLKVAGGDGKRKREDDENLKVAGGDAKINDEAIEDLETPPPKLSQKMAEVDDEKKKLWKDVRARFGGPYLHMCKCYHAIINTLTGKFL